MPTHRLPRPFVAAAFAAVCASAPAQAQSPLGDVAVGFVTGAAVAVAGTMVVAWLVLRDRVARRGTWVPYVVVSVLLMAAGAWRAGQQAWWLFLAGLCVLAWGLLLIFWLARRMLKLLDERDHARAEAKQVRRASERDALTGVLNRGAWRERLELLAADMQDAGRSISVLFFDIDLF